MFEFLRQGISAVRDWATKDVWDYINRRPVGEEKVKSGPGPRIPYFLPYQDPNQTAGETSEIRAAYRLMLADPDVKAAWLNKMLGVMALDLNIRPYKKKHPRHKLIADFVKWNLTTRLTEGVPGLIWDILSGATIDGWSLCEPQWTVQDVGEHRGRLVLRRLKAKDVWQDLVPIVDAHRNIVSIRGLRYNDGTDYSPKDFLIYTHLGLYENPVGTSDFRAAYASWWFLDTVQKLRAMGAERRATPIVMGEYPDVSKQPALEAALAAISRRNWLAVPKDVKLQAVDMAGKADDIFSSFTRDLRERIWIGLDGATLQSMQSAAGAVRGNSQVHKDTADLRKWYLSAAIAHILNDQESGLIREMVDSNFVGAEGYPTASLGGVDAAELKEDLAIAEGLQRMGWKHSKEAIEDRFSWPWGEGDDALEMPQQGGMGGMGGGMGDLGAMLGGGGGGAGIPGGDEDPTAKADPIADILGGLYGESIVEALGGEKGVEAYAEKDWVHAPGPRSPNRWRQLRTGRIEYSVENPGKHEGKSLPAETKEKRPEISSKVDDLVSRIKSNPEERTPENASKLIDHLGKLTVAEIHAIKQKYGLKAGAAWKSLLVEKVAQRLQYGMPERSTKNRKDRWGLPAMPELPPEIKSHLEKQAVNLDQQIEQESAKLKEEVANARSKGIRLPGDVELAAGDDDANGRTANVGSGSDRGNQEAAIADRNASQREGQTSSVAGEGQRRVGPVREEFGRPFWMKGDSEAVIQKHLGHLDTHKIQNERLRHDNVLDTFDRKVEKLNQELQQAQEQQKYATSPADKRRTKAAVAKAMQAKEGAERERRYYRTGDENWKNVKDSIAIDETVPVFVRVATGGQTEESRDAVEGLAREWLHKNGYDVRLAPFISSEAINSPVRVAQKFSQVLDESKTRLQMINERREARDFVRGLDLLPHHQSEAEREAGSIYAGGISEFKKKWTKKSNETREERDRQAEAKRIAEENATTAQKKERAVKDLIASIYRGEPIKADTETLRNAASDIVSSRLKWHSGTNLPKGATFKDEIDRLEKEPALRYKSVKSVTEHGFFTDGRYAMKATPEMIDYAKSRGVDKLEGRTPPILQTVNDFSKSSDLVDGKLIANRVSEYGTQVSLARSSDGTQVAMNSQFVANILKHYPNASLSLNAKRHSGVFKVGNETVAIVVGLTGDHEKGEVEVSPERRLSISESFEPGPYSPEDVIEGFAGFEVGRGDNAISLRLLSHGDKEKRTYTLSDGTNDYGPYFTKSEYAKAAKELLSHAHGKDEEGGLVFRAKGEQAAELAGDEKKRVDFYRGVRETAKAKMRAKPERVEYEGKDPLDVVKVTDHLGVIQTKGKGGKTQYETIHTPTGLALSAWPNKEAAIGHAIVAQHSGIDWGSLTGRKDLSPEQAKRVKELAAVHKGIVEAYMNDEWNDAFENHPLNKKQNQTDQGDGVTQPGSDAVKSRPPEHWGSKAQPYWRPGANPTVDNVITRDNPQTGQKEILLIQRATANKHGEPVTEGGKWALPGGFHDSESKKGEVWRPGKETAEEAAIRELAEETGLDASELKSVMRQIGEYEGGGRDPRDNEEAWSKSTAFHLHLSPEMASRSVAGQDDASEAKWVPVGDLGKISLAFDHGKIVSDARIAGSKDAGSEGVGNKNVGSLDSGGSKPGDREAFVAERVKAAKIGVKSLSGRKEAAEKAKVEAEREWDERAKNKGNNSAAFQDVAEEKPAEAKGEAKEPWEMSKEDYAASVGAPKPGINLFGDVSRHQLASMSDQAKKERADRQVAKNSKAREAHNKAVGEWESHVRQGFESGKLKLTDFDQDDFDADALSIVSDALKDKGIEIDSPFRLRNRPDRGEYLRSKEKEYQEAVTDKPSTSTPWKNKPTETTPKVVSRSGEHRNAVHQAFDDLGSLREYQDGPVPMPRIFAQARAKRPDLTVEDFHRELKAMREDGTLNFMVLNEVRGAKESEKAIREGDNLYYFATPGRKYSKPQSGKVEQPKQPANTGSSTSDVAKATIDDLNGLMEHAKTGVPLPKVYSKMRQANPALTLQDFHAAVKKLADDGHVVLSAAGADELVSEGEKGISDGGKNLYYVRPAQP